MNLKHAVAQALRPRGAAERLSRLLVPGVAPSGVLERLPPELRSTLEGDEPNPVLARRAAIAQITLALDELVQEGQVRRSRVQLKSALVDVYRLRWRR